MQNNLSNQHFTWAPVPFLRELNDSVADGIDVAVKAYSKFLETHHPFLGWGSGPEYARTHALQDPALSQTDRCDKHYAICSHTWKMSMGIE